MIRKPCSEFLVASCAENGGVYCYCLYHDGKITLKQKISMPSPMYLQLQGERLWAILRAPFRGSDESGVACYDVNTGKQIVKTLSTRGEVACHLTVDGDTVYCANYISGNIFKSPSCIHFHEGQGVNAERQKSPHPHAVVLSPDRRFLLSSDLGLDKVFVYDRELRRVSEAGVPGGAGARHLVFSLCGRFVYCVNEMGGSVSVFSYENGIVAYLDTFSVLPDGYSSGASAAIKLSSDGRLLYVTERASQRIVTLIVNGDRLSPVAYTDCHGEEPRDFTLLANGRFAVCTNQFSGNVALFKIREDGIPDYLNGFEIPSPLCAVEKKENHYGF